MSFSLSSRNSSISALYSASLRASSMAWAFRISSTCATSASRSSRYRMAMSRFLLPSVPSSPKSNRNPPHSFVSVSGETAGCSKGCSSGSKQPVAIRWPKSVRNCRCAGCFLGYKGAFMQEMSFRFQVSGFRFRSLEAYRKIR